ncbi:MAG: hypothetical protein A2010_17745 [Nitrospirae bacterium GWD2_57_9]|nr:MAG: hypothetical protein A2010_17745 [Nitrospirae bacterium GWD2_57_9]
MKKNMGMVDRVLRTVLAVIVAILYFSGQLTGTAAVILGVFAVIFVVTSSIGYCPAYTLLGVSTLKPGEHGHGPEEAHHKGAH